MIEVIVTFGELEKIQYPEVYIQSKLRAAGIPITGFFTANNLVDLGKLKKETFTDKKLIIYTWEGNNG